MKRLMSHIGRFKCRESGAAMVEFALVLPFLLLFLGVIIEGSRITWIHQATSAGVRDASRTIARIAPLDLCAAGTVGDYDPLATDIVQNQLDGSSAFPGGATVVNVTPTCISRSGTYRLDPTSVVQVTADVRIELIFGSVFALFGDAIGTLDMRIADQTRVYGV